MNINDDVKFITKRCSSITNEEFEMACDLYSNHYGFWNQNGPHPGQKIRMDRKIYREMMLNDDAFVSFAFLGKSIIGQAFFIAKEIEKEKRCSWVTQLVVNTEYRENEIGKRLLFSVWGFSNDHMWGLATTSPMTIKTLESATLRKVSVEEIKKHENLILTLKEYVPFFSDKDVCISDNNAVIKSNFNTDTSYLSYAIPRYGNDWPFASTIESGDEWLGFVFQDQPFRKLMKKDLEKYFDYPLTTIVEAYSRMDMDNQKWASLDYAKKEIDAIRKYLPKDVKSHIADFGCGTGRHSMVLADMGYERITGIDFSPSHISKAKTRLSDQLRKRIDFIVGDCSSYISDNKFDFILCAYDVVGSMPKVEDNQAIVNNIYNNLAEGGTAIVSAMNIKIVLDKFKKKHINGYIDIDESPEKLFKLKSSNNMQKTGEIFDPQYILIDSKTKVIYRKEYFVNDGLLNTEFIIRDYRYTGKELINMFVKAGFKRNKCRYSYVAAGKWDSPLKPNDSHAKEILLVASK